MELDAVKCSECQMMGMKSRVYQGITTMTLLYCQPYYDELGNIVYPPSPNKGTTTYRCSNGHNWTGEHRGFLDG
jgi:hypothetical protein